jgi:Flp pilus assembly protein protease CpaA
MHNSAASIVPPTVKDLVPTVSPSPADTPIAGEESALEDTAAPAVLIPATHVPGEEGATEGPSTSRIAASWVIAFTCAALLAATLQLASKQREYGFFLLSLTFVIAVAAAGSDISTRRIPNILTYPAVLIGLALNGALPLVLSKFELHAAEVWLGASGSLDCVQGFGLCAAIGVVSFMARGLGGGDVKLLAAVGALMGFQASIAILGNTLLIAAVLGIANWAFRGGLMTRLQSLASAVYFSVVFKSNMRSVYAFKATEGPFALSLLLGLTLAQFVALHRVILSVGW